MRIERVRLAGIGPFREEQVVDFEAFARDGLFLIAGRTGSGKSSILDAIVYAIYDDMPRYESSSAHRPIRSDHAQLGDASFVEVTFTLPAGRYRVWRAPEYERPKARGTGTTLSKATARLDRFRDTDDDAAEASAWESIAVGPRDVGLLLAELLPLRGDQFMQVVLLAQNRFHEFLTADSKQRAQLLRALFVTHRFEELAARIDDRRREAQQEHERTRSRMGVHASRIDELAARSQRLAPLLGVDGATEDDPERRMTGEERLALLDQHLSGLDRAARRRVTAVDRGFAVADAHLARVASQHAAQERRDAAKRELATLESAAEDVERRRKRLERATAAAPLLPLVRAVGEATETVTTATDLAHAALHDERHDGRADAEDARDTGDDRHPASPARMSASLAEAAARRDRATAAIGRLEPTLGLERERPSLIEQISTDRAALATTRTSLERVAEQLAALPEQRARYEAEVNAHGLIAAGLARAQSDLAQAARARDAALLAQREHVALVEARATLDAARATVQQHDDHHSDLLRARIDNAAALLAAKLQPGAPCLVCGAVEHPSPAVGDEGLEAVTDEAIADAEARTTSARQERDQAQLRVDTIAERWRAADAAAGGHDVAVHEQRVAEAEARVADATSAEQARDAAAGHVARLDEERASSEASQAQLRRDLDAQANAVAAGEARRSSLDEQIAAARGSHASVAEAQTAAMHDRDAAEATVRALGDLRAARERLDGARHELADELRGVDLARLGIDPQHEPALDDVGDIVQRAAMSGPDREALLADIQEHRARLEGVRARLADADLRELPDERVDLSAATRARSTAVTTRDAVKSQAVEVEQLRRDLANVTAAMTRDTRDEQRAATTYERLRGLSDALRGQGSNELRMSLETYVLAAHMEDIVVAANERLATMSSGRYQLQHDDSLAKSRGASGLGLVVLDQYTGRTRSTRSLSGGETFLASLALALGLSDTVTARAGGVQLDTMFIDEGFGSLDGQTLDDAMATLDSLRAGGRTVGVISHVEAMHEQIPARLELRVTARGDSVIEQPGLG